jgi:hypothetical protein
VGVDWLRDVRQGAVKQRATTGTWLLTEKDWGPHQDGAQGPRQIQITGPASVSVSYHLFTERGAYASAKVLSRSLSLRGLSVSPSRSLSLRCLSVSSLFHRACEAYTSAKVVKVKLIHQSARHVRTIPSDFFVVMQSYPKH